MNQGARLIIVLDPSSFDDEELDALTRQLMEEVGQSGVDSVGLVSGNVPPPGAKAGGLEQLGTLAVQVVPAALPALIGLLRDWSHRGRGRTVRVRAQVAGSELEIDYPVGTMSQEDLKQFVETITGALKTETSESEA